MKLITPNISIDGHKEQGAGHARWERCSWRHTGPTTAHPSPVQGPRQKTCSNRTPNLRVPDLSCQTQGLTNTVHGVGCRFKWPVLQWGHSMLEGWGNETIYLCIYPYLPMYLCIRLTLSTCHVAIYDSIICPSIIIFITYHLYVIYYLSSMYHLPMLCHLLPIYHLFITYLSTINREPHFVQPFAVKGYLSCNQFGFL